MKYLKLTGEPNHDDKQLEKAASLIKSGEVIAFPTETVYGLGANAYDEYAINKIFNAKGRPADNPLIVHVATKAQFKKLIINLPTYVEKLIDAFSPGPITYVLEHNGTCAGNVTAGLKTIAIRIPDHPIAIALIRKSDLPIAAPSANLSGKPSPTLASHVVEDLSGKISAIIDGGETGIGVESTVIDCTGEHPVILRHGGITKEQIQSIVAVTDVSEANDENIVQPKSPGVKYKHYAPDVPLILVDGNTSKLKKVIQEKRTKHYRIGLLGTEQTLKKIAADKKMSLGNSEQEVAQNLYKGLRLLSKENIDFIVCQGFEKAGVGQAIMDRLERAATHIIKN